MQVNGQTNFKVLLNGKETSMFAQNIKEALKGFPGALIQKIEVITSPSAKYDAEGVGGIINIITKKKMKGYNGSLSFYQASTGWYNGNLNFSMKTGKWGISYFQYMGGVNGMNAEVTTETLPLKPSIFSRRFLQGEREFDNLWGNGNAEISYENAAYYVQDLESKNGTWVNKTKLLPKQKMPISHRDSLRIGHFMIQVGSCQYS